MEIAQPDSDGDNSEEEGKLENQLGKMDKSKEVSQLEFISFGPKENEDFKMLVTTSWDSALQVYNEEDEDSRLLRKSIGGHGEEDIICLEISNHLSLIATGSSAGSVVVWDFEMSKIDGICCGHTKTIT
jgi:WD40 repeat protein